MALGELVEETLAEREAEVADRPVELRAEGTSRHAEIHTDRGRLKQILINLVANALRFTESGNVTVRIEHGEGDSAPVALHVEDTGIGIPSDRLDAIFEAFQQAEDGTARRYGGTGLGLTISRSLCHMLGFALEVHSEVGEGSTFTVRFQPESTEPELPREGMPVRPAEDRWSDQGDGGEERPLEGRTVLVVDDEQDARTLLRSALEDLGATVLEATNGLEGLEVARRVEPHLITLDLMMPGMDGSEFMRRLRRDPQLMDTPVVVVSMLAGEDGHRFVGAADVLSKPVEASDLEGVVSRLVGTSEGRVLVVEDDPDARHLLLRYLTDSGLDADGVDSAEAALAYMDRTPVGLLILDLVLPGMDGMELMERMRSMDSLASLPMVVLTGRELSREEEDIIRGHGARLVHKREDVDRELRRALDALFGRRGEQHDQ
ncbi:MAG: response regulator [Gemmatimonadales bacterium]|nr:MAG: response regulator [Gemmatimonadales bacterium]